MHNYFKCLKTLLFFNSNMHHLDTGDILNNLKEVNKKEKVIAYYEGVQKS